MKILLLFFLIPFDLFCQTLVSNSAVGGVTHNSARFRVHVSGEAEVNVRLSTSENFNHSFEGSAVITDSSEDFTAIVESDNLSPLTTYFYQILINDVPADNKIRSFTTFPSPGSESNFSFIFGSCQQSSISDNGNVFSEIVKHEPDLFLQIGDWTYPDNTEDLPTNVDFFANDYSRVLQSYRTKFSLNYNMDTLLRSVPVSYVYDDHDYMNNNASALTVTFALPFRPNPYNSDYLLEEIPVPPSSRLNSIRGFINNMPDYPVENSSRGIYRKFIYGNAEFYMLDLRSQRSPNLNSLVKNISTGKWEFVQPSGHTMLGSNNSPGSGEDQFIWLKRNLLQSTAKWKFLVSSIPLNKGQTAGIEFGLRLQDSVVQIPGSDASASGIIVPIELTDKWVGFREELDSLLSFIRWNKISNVFVLSGDSHTSAMDDGTNAGLPEIMSGNLDIPNSRTAALFNFLGINIWNKGGQGISTNTYNNAFGKVEIHGSDSVSFSLIDENGIKFSGMTMNDQDEINISLQSFTAAREGSDIKLTWRIEPNSSIRNFEIQDSEDGIIFSRTGSVNYSGTDYNFTHLYQEGRNYHRLKINGSNGSFIFSQIISSGEENIKGFYLSQNYPNPFNSTTRINFGLQEDSRVSITLYNVLGEKVRTILDEPRSSGEHEIELNASTLSSGIYLYRIQTDKYSESKKMLLLK